MFGKLEIEAEKPSLYSPLALAYMGDCVYEMYVRHHLIAQGNLSAHKLHKAAMKYVCAEAQSAFVEVLEPLFSEEEETVYKRGRNAKSPTVPKHAKVTDYKRATGLETLLGFLYLEGRQERIDEIMTILFKKINERI